jgi:hypothetical protein
MQECRHQPETGSKAFEERVATGVFPSFTLDKELLLAWQHKTGNV